MLIVITKDQSIIDWVNSEDSGAANWGAIKILSVANQGEANSQMAQLLKLVKSNEPLAITGHGNDEEVGDEGVGAADWCWTHAQLAELLGGLVPDYKGPVLMEVCADSVSDFAAHLVVSLEKLEKLNGVWVYGYNKSIGVTHPFPTPDKLDGNAELTGKQVNF